MGRGVQGRLPFSHNFPFEIPEIFHVKIKERLSFHAEEKLAVSLPDQNTWRDGARLTLILDRAVEMV